MNAPLHMDKPCAHDGEAERLAPGRLWSLWDMLRVYAKPFIEAAEIIGQLKIAIVVDATAADKKTIDLDGKSVLIGRLERLIEQLDILGLGFTKVSANRVLGLLQGGDPVSIALLSLNVLQLSDRLNDELEYSYLLSLSLSEKELFDSDAPLFGAAVLDAFPSVAYEIDEAAKCLALGRSTASVFHSMRCLEAAIGAISRCLGIPDPTKGSERSWMRLLGRISEEMDRRWPKSWRIAGDGKMFEEIFAALASLQNPWRNSTMHLDQKYTEDEARHMFEMVGGLMKKLASRMDENGLPLA